MMTDGGGWTLEPTPTAVVSSTPTVTPDVTPTPQIDSRVALAKLTSGQTLTAEDRKILGMSTPSTTPTVTPTPTPTPEPSPNAPYVSGSKEFGGKTYATAAGAYAAAVNAAKTAGPPYTAPSGTHWTLIGTEWKLYKDLVPTVSTGGNTGGNVGGNVNGNVGGNTGGNVVTGSSTNVNTPTTPTLARDVFKNTLGLLFGQAEVGKAWMDELYTVVSKYYKTGASAEESFNLAVQDIRNNPNMQEFTKRFKGIYALQDLRQQGKPVTVPTIAEYFATQTKMADLLKSTGLADIATEDFLGDVIGKGVSATEFGNRITNIFDRIDLAPQEIKDTLSRYYPTLDRLQLAKALALGEKGAVQLQKDLATYEILGAAENQGLGAYGAGAISGGLTEERAASLAASGETYQSALGKFKTIAQLKTPAEKLAAIYGTGPMTQADLENIVFKQSALETTALENLVKAEEAAFSGQSGNIGSRSFASQARGAGLI